MGTEQETLVEVTLNDAELFNGAMSDEPAAEAPAEPEKPVEQPDGPARDEQGRFVAKTEAETAPKTEAPVEPAVEDADKGGQIPSWRLREEREAKAEAIKALEVEKAERTRLANEFAQMQRQLAELRQPAPKKPEDEPDPLLDPAGFREHMRREFQEQLLAERRESSLRAAHRQYGEAFAEAYADAQKAMAQGDRLLPARMQAASDPGETLIQWHREQKTMREVGPDPAAYRQRLLDEALKDPAYLAKAIEAAKVAATPKPNGNTAPAVRLPPSLSSAARADASHSSEPDENDISDGALFRHATR